MQEEEQGSFIRLLYISVLTLKFPGGKSNYLETLSPPPLPKKTLSFMYMYYVSTLLVYLCENSMNDALNHQFSSFKKVVVSY